MECKLDVTSGLVDRVPVVKDAAEVVAVEEVMSVIVVVDC